MVFQAFVSSRFLVSKIFSFQHCDYSRISHTMQCFDHFKCLSYDYSRFKPFSKTFYNIVNIEKLENTIKLELKTKIS